MVGVIPLPWILQILWPPGAATLHVIGVPVA
jgi:hypothetical protein